MRLFFTVFVVLLAAYSVKAQQRLDFEEHLKLLSERRALVLIYSPAVLPDTSFAFDASLYANAQLATDALLRPFDLYGTELNGQLIITRDTRRRKFTVSGFVEDAATKERLVGATIFHPESGRGVLTNGYGYFSAAGLSRGDRLIVGYVGAPLVTLTVTEEKTNLVVRLRQTLELGTVEVLAKSIPLSILPMDGKALPPSVLDPTEFRIGDRDINTWLSTVPGVQSSPGGFRGYSIRGSDPSQNLVMVDDATLYVPSHAAGYLSAIPGVAVRSVQLFKNGGPVRHGDRVGGVLDVRLKEGDKENRKTNFSVGAFDIGAATEGPIGKGSYFVSGRRGLTDFWLNFLRPSVQPAESSIPNIDVRFHDLTGKINYPLNDRNRLYASVYFGRDRYQDQDQRVESDISGIDEVNDRSRRFWSNSIASLRHNVAIGSKWFANTTATFSQFEYDAYDYLLVESDINTENATFSLEEDNFRSQLLDLGLRSDIEYAWRADARFAFGLDATAHSFQVGTVSVLERGSSETGSAPEPETSEGLLLPSITTYDVSAYASVDYNLTDRIQVDGGLRLSSQLGTEETFLGLLPRMSLAYKASRRIGIRVDAGIARQYIHLISTQNPGLPRDLWVPTVDGLRPQRSRYASVGFDLGFPGKPHAISISAYGQLLTGLSRFAIESDVLPTERWQDNVELGTGQNAGIEVSGRFKKNRYELRGSYTLATATRQYTDRFGSVQAEERDRLDRRHSANLQGTIQLGKRWAASMTTTIASGLPTRVPRKDPFREDIPSTNVPLTNSYWVYSGRQVQLPAFQQVDLGGRYVHARDGVEYRLTFGVQNILLRKNPLFLNLRQTDEAAAGQSDLTLTQFSLLPVLPFARYTVVF